MNIYTAVIIFVLFNLMLSCSTPRLPYDFSTLEAAPIDSISNDQIRLEGVVTDMDGAPILFGSIGVYLDGVLIKGVETDFDGYYTLQLPNSEHIIIELSYVGYKKHRYTLGGLKAGYVYSANLKFLNNIGRSLSQGCGPRYQIPLIEMDNTTQGAIYTGDRLRKMPTY